MKKTAAALGLGACLLLASCGRAALPYAREMGDMALLRTMGVDAAEGGGVEITASTGRRAAGLQGEGQPPLILSAQGGSISAACLALQGLSDSYVFFGYVDQLLLGEGAALAGIQPVLDYFSRDVELGLGAQVWLIRGEEAGAAIGAGGESGVDGRLSTLQTDSELGIAGITRTAGEVFSGLLEAGCAYLPALRVVEPEKTGGQTVLMEAGYGILREDRLVGYLDGEEARGLELLTGQAGEDVLEAELSSGGVVARVTGGTVRWEPVYQGNELERIQLYCLVTAELAEYAAPLEEGELDQLREILEERESLRLQRVLDQLRSWGTDCVGLASQVGRADPARWDETEENWEQLFPAVPLSLSVEVTVSRSYGELKE